MSTGGGEELPSYSLAEVAQHTGRNDCCAQLHLDSCALLFWKTRCRVPLVTARRDHCRKSTCPRALPVLRFTLEVALLAGVVVDGLVLDATPFLDRHPGGHRSCVPLLRLLLEHCLPARGWLATLYASTLLPGECLARETDPI